MKALPHWLHLDGFFSVCGLICILELFFTDMVTPQCVTSYVLQDYYLEIKLCHNGCIDIVYLQCVFSYVF